MDLKKTINKIDLEIHDSKSATNYAKALLNTPEDFKAIIAEWLDGREPEYDYRGITLSMIREKERCSYLYSLLRMQLLLSDPVLAAGYAHWRPVNKDRGR